MNNELYHYNHNHDPKTGKFRSSKGSRLENRILRVRDRLRKNEEQRAAVEEKYNRNSIRNKRDEAKVSALTAKRASLEKRVYNANRKEQKGKELNFFDKSAVKKAGKLDKQIARLSSRKLKHDTKIASLDYKHEKLSRLLDRYISEYEKYTTSDLSADSIAAGRNTVSVLLNRR